MQLQKQDERRGCRGSWLGNMLDLTYVRQAQAKLQPPWKLLKIYQRRLRAFVSSSTRHVGSLICNNKPLSLNHRILDMCDQEIARTKSPFPVPSVTLYEERLYYPLLKYTRNQSSYTITESSLMIISLHS